jgi:colanic acid/amylovoran biosynthesis glycosyltransferase
MSQERVGYVLKMFPRFSETFILSELLELERQGTEIEVFSLRPPADGCVHGDLGRLRARVHYVPQARWTNTPTLVRAHLRIAVRRPLAYLPDFWRALRRRRGPWRDFVQAGWIATQARSARIEHLHAHFASIATSVALHVQRLAGTSYSFTAHAKDIFIDGVDPRDLRRKLGSARFAVTVSDYNLRYLGPLDERGALVRIYNGLDLDQFSFAGTGGVGTDGVGTSPVEPPLILAVGRLIEKKGFADLVRACALLREQGLRFRCRIVGSGKLEADLRRLIDELDLAGLIHLVGPMTREELIELLPRAAAFAAPCVVGCDGNRDGLPTVLIEAMARGVPVVATDVTGIPELVRDGETGLIVPQHDPAAVADALQRLLTDRALACRLAGAGRATVEERFNLSHNVARLRSLLLDTAAAR